jgi:hypothetical protein
MNLLLTEIDWDVPLKILMPKTVLLLDLPDEADEEEIQEVLLKVVGIGATGYVGNDPSKAHGVGVGPRAPNQIQADLIIQCRENW